MQQLLSDKKINPNAFKKYAVHLKDNITKHAAFAFEHIYSLPHKQQAPETEHKGIARFYHGIQHTGRVAMYIPVLANLYRRYGDEEAKLLTDETLKLIQIAALFHDSAREDDNEDKWDHESGLLLYYYLTEVLNVNKQKAKEFAEAITNKDATKDYKSLVENKDGSLDWIASAPRKKNILQKLIHDADCLDIIRARDHFEAPYLDIYKQFVEKENNITALYEIARLITEARCIIDIQGDTRGHNKIAKKKLYENKNAYSKNLKTIQQKHFQILPQMYANGALLNDSELQNELLKNLSIPLQNKTAKTIQEFLTNDLANIKEFKIDLTNPNLVETAINSGMVLARGVPTPSAYRNKDLKGERKEETLLQTELRKVDRTRGFATRTSKFNNKEKDGNPSRSTSLLGTGGTVFSCSGLLKFGFNLNDITSFSYKDVDTGRYKKIATRFDSTSLTEKRKQFVDLWLKQLQGGSSRRFNNECFATHSECIYHIHDFDAIYFTQDPVFGNTVLTATGSDSPIHRYSPILQAIYLQNERARFDGVRLKKERLPIFEYSGLRNFIKRKEYKPENVLYMWKIMCADYLKKELKKDFTTVFDLSIDDLKTMAMYGNIKNHLAKNEKNRPADDNYDETFYGPHFKEKIDASIKEIQYKYLIKYLNQLPKEFNDNLYDKKIFWKIFFNSPDAEKINPKKIKTTNLFSMKSFDAHIDSSDVSDIKTLLNSNKSIDPGVIYKQTESCTGSSKETKYYLLAKKLGNAKKARIIQKKALQEARQQLNLLKNETSFNMIKFKLIYSMKIIALFDLKNTIKKSLHSNIDILLNHKKSARLLAKPKEWSHFKNFVWLLKEFDLLNPEIKKNTQQTLIELSQRFIHTDYSKTCDKDLEQGFDLTHFINLAKECELDRKKQIEIVIEYLNHHTLENHRNYALAWLANELVSILDDHHVFRKVIEALATDDFVKRINIFKSGLGDDIKSWQNDIINSVIQDKKQAIDSVAINSLNKIQTKLPHNATMKILGFFGLSKETKELTLSKLENAKAKDIDSTMSDKNKGMNVDTTMSDKNIEEASRGCKRQRV